MIAALLGFALVVDLGAVVGTIGVVSFFVAILLHETRPRRRRPALRHPHRGDRAVGPRRDGPTRPRSGDAASRRVHRRRRSAQQRRRRRGRRGGRHRARCACDAPRCRRRLDRPGSPPSTSPWRRSTSCPARRSTVGGSSARCAGRSTAAATGRCARRRTSAASSAGDSSPSACRSRSAGGPACG